jgi:hypothetical protein
MHIRSRLSALLLSTALLSCSQVGPAGIDDSDGTTPQLSLSTAALGFASAVGEHTITMTNGDSAPVAWSAGSSTPWLVVTPGSGTLAPGTTTLTVRVTRTQLGPGTYSGQVRVTASDLALVVEVTAEVDARPIASLDATSIDFDPDRISAEARLTNSGNAPLAWSLAGPAWIALSPAAGTIAPGSTQTITLTPDRSTLPAGTHQANLALTSDGGAATLAVRVEVAAPALLRVTPSVIGFGLVSQSSTVTIANDGGRSLTWTLSSDRTWLQSARSSGTLAPGASETVAVTGSRQGLTTGTHTGSLNVSSNGGTAVVGATIEVSQTAVALAGQVVDQFTGAGIGGLTVRFNGTAATTDASGRFSVPGAPSGSLENLSITGSSVYTRNTFARSTDSQWLAIRSSFDMTAYNDVAREYAPWTIRWIRRPNVYIDTSHIGPDPGIQLQTWITEALTSVEGFITEWSSGTAGAASVTVGTSPPPDGTTGWIIVRFDDDPSHYSGATTVGNANTGWNANREILYSTIRLRFSLVPGPVYASVRTAVLGHELGHALGMGHMEGSTPSIMTPRITLTSLSSFDSKAASIVYSRSPGNTAPDTDNETFYLGGLSPAVVSGENRWICDAPDLPGPLTP